MGRMTRMLFLLVGIGMLLLQPLSAEELQNGEALYGKYCAQCHGQDLRGGMAQSLLDGVWQFGGERGYIMRNIKFGITHLGMPAYEKSLTDQQIRTIVDHMAEAEKTAGVTKPPPPKQLQTMDYDVQVQVWAEQLDIPWGIDFVDEQTAFVTERGGHLRVVKDGVLQSEPVAGTPTVLAEGQGGLMDVAVDPDYAENGWIYLAYSHALEGGEDTRRPPAMTRIVRGHVSDNTWTNQQIIYEAPHDTYRTTRHHYGCRIVFDPEGYLYFCIGDRGADEHAQDLSKPNGKVHRIHRDGSIPDTNPFADQPEVLKTIFSYGHRNPQGLSVHPDTGRVWESEHGPMGGDELNLLTEALNYGWPVISYGRNYNGSIITELVRQPGMEQPAIFWRPSPAVCGIDFYRGDLFPKWRNCLIVGALKYEEVTLLTIEQDRVMHQETILKSVGRVRDVACGPDGAVYVLLNKPDMILRLTPVIEMRDSVSD